MGINMKQATYGTVTKEMFLAASLDANKLWDWLVEKRLIKKNGNVLSRAWLVEQDFVKDFPKYGDKECELIKDIFEQAKYEKVLGITDVFILKSGNAYELTGSQQDYSYDDVIYKKGLGFYKGVIKTDWGGIHKNCYELTLNKEVVISESDYQGMKKSKAAS